MDALGQRRNDAHRVRNASLTIPALKEPAIVRTLQRTSAHREGCIMKHAFPRKRLIALVMLSALGRLLRRGRGLSEPAHSRGRAVAARRADRRGRARAVAGNFRDAASAGRDRQQGRRHRRDRQRLRGEGGAGWLHHRRRRHREPFAGEDRQRQAAVRSAQGLSPDHRIRPLPGRHFRRRQTLPITNLAEFVAQSKSAKDGFRSACRASDRSRISMRNCWRRRPAPS